jgi:2-oxoglutarate ferredoxin oxidoreductase subunit delta
MAKIIIERDKCKGCLLCVSVCPKGLIIVDKDLNQKGVNPVKFSPLVSRIPSKARQVNDECLGCSLCAIMCPDCCIEVYK